MLGFFFLHIFCNAVTRTLLLRDQGYNTFSFLEKKLEKKAYECSVCQDAVVPLGFHNKKKKLEEKWMLSYCSDINGFLWCFSSAEVVEFGFCFNPPPLFDLII
ncbi:hypothetical protein SK128_026968 [Halocaridina rubra]|uniref:Uncharacterized protein n=1 Tax=Halocaridina rubra TaxID=373956 RepID=A0AAN8X9P2_HALRR